MEQSTKCTAVTSKRENKEMQQESEVRNLIRKK
jgi:hypothetical protein